MFALPDELSKMARTLAQEERAQLEQELMESIDQESDPEVARACETEIASRVARYERGQAKLIPASEVFEAARQLTQ
jgi:putative addiction module component (TIGR02574 family)